jgi:hypothetical protein
MNGVRPAHLDSPGRASILDLIRTLSHSLRVRLFAAALLLPLVAFATAMGGVGLRCRMTGALVSACCCDGDGAMKTTPFATVSEADCCDRVVSDGTTAPAEPSRAPRALPDPTTPVARLAFVAKAIDRLPSVFASRSWSQARADLGPPTVRLRLVSKSSFLI